MFGRFWDICNRWENKPRFTRQQFVGKVVYQLLKFHIGGTKEIQAIQTIVFETLRAFIVSKRRNPQKTLSKILCFPNIVPDSKGNKFYLWKNET